MMISSFDLATSLTGWCAGSGEELPQVGAWEFPQVGENLGRLGVRFRRVLEQHLDAFDPGLVVYEAPILVVKRGEHGRTDKVLTLRKLYGLGFLLETVCLERAVECREAGLQRIKTELAGFSRAAKADMVHAARKAGLNLPEPGADDAADAFGGWLLALRDRSPRLSARWDRVLYSSRGALL